MPYILQQLAVAQTETPPVAPQGPNPMNMIFFMVAIFGIFYFLTIRPNQKREKERQAMLAALSKGDKVVTAGGMFGTIVGLNEKTVVLRVGDEPGTKIEFLRSAVSRAVPRDGKGE
jgi:preprotein translocase subunit YajC